MGGEQKRPKLRRRCGYNHGYNTVLYCLYVSHTRFNKDGQGNRCEDERRAVVAVSKRHAEQPTITRPIGARTDTLDIPWQQQ